MAMTESQKRANRKYDAKRKGARAKNWVFILYPESAPENWRSLLGEYHIQWIESPLHDKDTNDDEEHTPKKPHYHIMLCFPSLKSYEQAKEVTDSLNCPIPQAVKSMVGQVRYFAHLDNPEKYQYNRADVVGHGGIDVQGIIDTGADKIQVLMEILTFIQVNRVYRFNTLVDFAMKNNQTWFRLLANGYTRFVTEYLRDMYHEEQENRLDKIKAEDDRRRFEKKFLETMQKKKD